MKVKPLPGVLELVLDGDRPIIGKTLRIECTSIAFENSKNSPRAYFRIVICGDKDRELVEIGTVDAAVGDCVTLFDMDQAFNLTLQRD